MSPEIRHAISGEAEQIVRLYEWLFAPPGSVPPAWDPAVAVERLERAIRSEDSTILLADDGGRLVGLLSAYIDLESVRFGRRCWVEDLAVDPERRSQGIGAALLTAGREWARGKGASHLELDSGVARPDAHRFYEREGAVWPSRSFTWLLAE